MSAPQPAEGAAQRMKHAWRRSLRFKVSLVVLVITGMALLLSATALLIYELRSYRQAWVEDLSTQAELVARFSAPALSFDDSRVARENLQLLQVRPQVAAAAVYTVDGRLFASYLRDPDAQGLLPATAGPAGHSFAGDRLELYHLIAHPAADGEWLGTVYLRADYDLRERLPAYLLILGGVMAASLAVAALVTARLQRTITTPILEVTQVAREVMQKRDFTLRAARTTSDEVGELVDAFNDMLAEVELRTDALEQSNEQLFDEMAQRRRAEEALTLAARTKDEFLATLAHELRNPLAPIGNAVEILRRIGDGEPALRAKALDIMGRQLRQMVRLIDDLLDVSRITTGKLLLHSEHVDLLAVLRAALEIAGPGIEARAHALVLNLPAGPAPVQGDATRLAQVFANLLNNASKYTDPGGRIELTLQQTDTEVVVRVADNGMGIAPELQTRIFEMFVQLNPSLERGRAGLGVGLSLARRLIEMHGGAITVFSDGVGQGSCFEVRLPRAAQAARASAHEPPALAPFASGRRRILVADDNVDFATSLANILESLGHETVIAHDGEEAVRLAHEHAPDAAFLDIGMPRLNGYEVATALRELPGGSGLLLVAITGWGQARDRERARAAGFDHHLVKPIELQQILPLLGIHEPH
jgi:signal transduction histidine kinase